MAPPSAQLYRAEVYGLPLLPLSFTCYTPSINVEYILEPPQGKTTKHLPICTWVQSPHMPEGPLRHWWPMQCVLLHESLSTPTKIKTKQKPPTSSVLMISAWNWEIHNPPQSCIYIQQPIKFWAEEKNIKMNFNKHRKLFRQLHPACNIELTCYYSWVSLTSKTQGKYQSHI